MQARPKTRITPVEAVEIGVRLMKLKAISNRGEFESSWDDLGFCQSDTSRLMRVGRRFHGVSNTKLLEAVDKVTKLYELLSLEDEELDTLKAGGEVHGITLANIKTMTVIELRRAIHGASCLRLHSSLSADESRVLREYRERTRNVQDVTDKRSTAPASVALAEDLFSALPPSAPTSAPTASVEIPKASGWHVAGLQFINPIGTWRMACPHVNHGTRYANVTFRPAPARAAYRAERP